MTCEELKKALEANNMKGVVLQHKRSKRQYHVDHDMLAYTDKHHSRPYIYGTPLANRRGQIRSVAQWFHLENMELAEEIEDSFMKFKMEKA